MTLALTCKHCGAEITSDTKDELVDRVQAHVRGHGATHDIPREAILRTLDKRSAKDDAA